MALVAGVLFIGVRFSHVHAGISAVRRCTGSESEGENWSGTENRGGHGHEKAAVKA